MSAPSYKLTITFISLAGFVQLSDFSLISVALPSIAQNLTLDPSQLSLIVASSTVIFAAFLILGGRLIDLYGQVQCSLAGLFLYMCGAAVAATALGAPALIGARALQGLGFALLYPASFSMLNTALPEGAIRNRGYGIYTSVLGVSLIVGSALGGAATTFFGWRVALLLNGPTALVAIGLAWKLLGHAARPSTRGALDFAGAGLVAVGTALLIWALSAIGRAGGLSAPGMGALGAGIAAFAIFILVERRVTSPLISPSVFRSPNVVGNSLASLFSMAAAAAMFLLPNMYMQRVLGYSAAQSGIGMLPMSLANIATGAFFSFAIGRFSIRYNAVLGFIIFLAGLLLFAILPLFVADNEYVLIVLLPLVVSSFGGTFCGMVLLAGTTMNLPLGQQGVTTSVLMTAQQIGLALGTSLVLTVVASGEAGGAAVDVSLRAAYLVAVASVVLGLITFVAMSRGGLVEAAKPI